MSLETDFIVIGSGVAGLRASIELAKTGARVTVLTKDKASESNTEYAQGGVAVVLSDDDNAELHEEDTLIAGAGALQISMLVAQHRRDLPCVARPAACRFLDEAVKIDYRWRAGAHTTHVQLVVSYVEPALDHVVRSRVGGGVGLLAPAATGGERHDRDDQRHNRKE